MFSKGFFNAKVTVFLTGIIWRFSEKSVRFKDFALLFKLINDIDGFLSGTNTIVDSIFSLVFNDSAKSDFSNMIWGKIWTFIRGYTLSDSIICESVSKKLIDCTFSLITTVFDIVS